MNKLQVNGNLLVTAAEITTSTQPTAAQTKTMVNGSTITCPITDSTGIIYSPGAPLSSYLPNLSATVVIAFDYNTIGIQIQFNGMSLSTGDSLVITDPNGVILLKVGNNYNTQGTYVFNTGGATVYFKSNADAFVGRGVALTYKRIYADKTTPTVTGFAGNSLFFNAQTGSFMAGTPINNPMGQNSVELGLSNTASGKSSFAMGEFNIASGLGSVAMGVETTAGGYSSFAMGENVVASGSNSTAIGNYVIAAGAYSTAIGYDVSTGNNDGVFIIGDSQTGNINSQTLGTVADQFVARFNNGYYLLSSDGLSSVGVVLPHGGNSWSAISDSAKKEKMVPVNGEDFLNKVASFKLSSWNYKGQDAKTFRHYGPMAQDFYNAFGKDAFGTIGCDTLINQQDFLGVNFIAIQALEKRTEKIVQLQQQNITLQNKVAQLENKLTDLNVLKEDNNNLQKTNNELAEKINQLAVSLKLLQQQVTTLVQDKQLKQSETVVAK